MKPALYHIKTIGRGTLSAMAMPQANSLEDNLNDLRQQGIDKILCLMESSESVSLGLQPQETLCKNTGLSFQRFEIKDYDVPSLSDLRPLVTQLHTEITNGLHLVVHCRGGIGRTGIICSCLLIATGLNASDAMAQVTEKRGCIVPETATQIELIRQFEHGLKA